MAIRSRRRVAAFAAALLAVSLSACSGEEPTSDDLSGNRVGAMSDYGVNSQFKATEALNFSILYNNHPNYPLKNEWLFWSELTKRTGVTLQPTAVPLSDYEQKRSLLIGAGDAPLIIPKTYPGQETPFVASGSILPVSDYLDLMPNFKDKVAKWNLQPDVDQLRQLDGKFYLLPGLHEDVWTDYSLGVRTDILAQLNLTAPKTWDEVYTMLKAMKAAYPNQYPMSDRWSKPTPGGALFNFMSPAFSTNGGWGYRNDYWDASAKKFVFTGATDGYKQMVTYLNKLVKEGLLDPESFTQDDDTAIQKLATGKSFVISANAQELVNKYRTTMAETLPKATMVKIPQPAGPAGDVKAGTRLENGIMISKKARDSKNFVAMMQFIDWLYYSDAGQEFAKWGVPGTTYNKDASGKFTLAPDVDYVKLNPTATKHLQKDFGFGNGVFAYGGTTQLLQSTFSAEELEYQKAMDAKQTLPLAPPHPYEDAEAEQATLWETPLKDHVSQMTLKFILGQRDLSEWDAYVAELKAKNMDAYIELVNKAYDRFAKQRG
ncbi:ABC transporter substrate-binding protein [Catellatospora citrea]|uniref:Sugar ABC transporter substrate-binding protein n=1 Tax=Catellatospora citrea TaxID=53366 RepID=A0A8J3K9W7_9ACTN|nr:extracellular solute-binding protein [Catellatospora citrea]RKE10403.1 carbohydrate ABC transporter substrate-binding protein (CUT1 family) [Catellatospora citrea]GIF99092.1 sugar ABC transporter substrate-binding protein [Catellatospora citrea]